MAVEATTARIVKDNANKSDPEAFAKAEVDGVGGCGVIPDAMFDNIT
jgi:hypothetical protein